MLSDIGWKEYEMESFWKHNNSLDSQDSLPPLNSSVSICDYMDGSDFLWSGFVTQGLNEDLPQLPVYECHQPLVFLSGQFSRSQLA